MGVTHRLTGYDRASDALAYEHEIPRTKTHMARDTAGVPQHDAGAIGAYPLRSDQARRIAFAIGARIDTERYEWFLEPVAAAVA